MPDPYFASKYGFSPYMACEHGCKYCDGRAEKYYVEGDFEKDIIIRKNLPELLHKEVPKLREKGFITISSGISDAYQPIEKEEKLMSSASEILAQNYIPASVLTKSNLILRDIEHWKEVNKKSRFLLMVSLTFTNDKHRKIFEPNTASVEERLEMLKVFKEQGMYTGVLAMPFIPFVSDNEKNIRGLLQKLKEIDIDFVMPGGLTLRPGRQKAGFMQIIKDNFPQHHSVTDKLFSQNRASGAAFSEYYNKLNSLTDRLLKEFNIPQNIPHYLYKDQYQIYDEVLILMNHLFNLFGDKKNELKRLGKAYKVYYNWLMEEKSYFARRRNLKADFIEDKFKELLNSGEFQKMTRNPKLTEFIKQVVFERRVFDYNSLKFTD